MMFRLRDLSYIPLLALTIGGIVAVTLLALVAANGNNEDDDADKNDISHGLGNHVDWVSLKEGLITAKNRRQTFDAHHPQILVWCLSSTEA